MNFYCIIVDFMLRHILCTTLRNLSKRFKINYIFIVIIIKLTLPHYFVTFTRITFTVIFPITNQGRRSTRTHNKRELKPYCPSSPISQATGLKCDIEFVCV